MISENEKKTPLRLHYRLTADKKLRYASPKLPSATSFIRKTLADKIMEPVNKEEYDGKPQ